MKIRHETKVHIGDSLQDVAARIVANVAKFESGEDVRENHRTFENWRALFALLTPKRYELLYHLHRHPEPSVRALSRSLDRDFKRVHEDVQALAQAGLIEKDSGELRADYVAIETRIPL